MTSSSHVKAVCAGCMAVRQRCVDESHSVYGLCCPGEWLWVNSNGTDGKPTFHRRAILSWFSKICNHFRNAAWSQKSLTVTTFFGKKWPLKGKFSKRYSERIHHLIEPRLVCKFREIWLTGNRQSHALFTWQKKQNFRKVSRSRFCADHARNLPGLTLTLLTAPETISRPGDMVVPAKI